MDQGVDKQGIDRIPEAGEYFHVVVDFEGDKYTLQIERMSDFFEKETGNPRLWVKWKDTTIIAGGVELRDGKWFCDSPWLMHDGTQIFEDHDWGSTVEEVAQNAFQRWVKHGNVGLIKLGNRNGTGLLSRLKELRRDVEERVTDLLSKASEVEADEQQYPLGDIAKEELAAEMQAIREALDKLKF